MAPLFALRFNESVICGCCERCPKTSHRPTKAGQQGGLLCATVKCARACTCASIFEYGVWVAVGFMHYGANLFRVTQSWQSNNNSAQTRPYLVGKMSRGELPPIRSSSQMMKYSMRAWKHAYWRAHFAWWKANSSLDGEHQQRDNERWPAAVWFGSLLSKHTIQTIQPDWHLCPRTVPFIPVSWCDMTCDNNCCPIIIFFFIT